MYSPTDEDYLKDAIESYVAMEIKAYIRSARIWEKIQKADKRNKILKIVSGRDFSKKSIDLLVFQTAYQNEVIAFPD